MKNKTCGGKLYIYDTFMQIQFLMNASGVWRLSDYPHYRKWLAVLRFLRQRGFTITRNRYYHKYSRINSQFHKLAVKGQVVCILEVTGQCIKFTYGHIKNLNTPESPTMFYTPTICSAGYVPLTYLEEISVKLEQKRLIEFAARYNLLEIDDTKQLTPEQYIVKGLRNNHHLHGEVNCLEDLKKSITEESYDWQMNSWDRNRKRIICGERKYFYDHDTGRLSCGIAWHHINNMWWIIVNNVLVRNLSSCDLFDFSPGLPRKIPIAAERVDSLLNYYSKKQDFKRCLAIQKHYKTEPIAA